MTFLDYDDNGDDHHDNLSSMMVLRIRGEKRQGLVYS